MHYVIADMTDCDGIISHALLKRKLKETVHFLADYPDFHKKLEEIIELPKGEIIVADMDLNPNIRKFTYLFEMASRKQGKLAWFDHHEGSHAAISFLEKYCWQISLDRNKCASLIIYETLMEGDAYAQWLAKLAQDYDYKNKITEEYKIAQKVQEVIKSEFGLQGLINILSENSSWQNNGSLIEKLESPRQEFLARKLKAYSEMEETVSVSEIFGLKIMFALSGMELYRADAPMYLKENNEADLFVVFFLNESGSAMVYGNTGKLKALDICCMLGGGGRNGNGGFNFGTPNTIENYKNKIEKMCEIIKIIKSK